MKTLIALVKRNTKLFFKDKGMFITSLITPVVLLVLYISFLAKIYEDSFRMHIPQGFDVAERLIDGVVGGQLIASLLAVSCVTVAFSSNFLMVQDRVNGSIKDIRISPVGTATVSLSYYLSSLLSTMIVCYSATALCLGWLAITGWYLSVADVLLLLFDVALLVLFGTALSSIINFFLTSQGQISAVGTIIGTGYGYICGAYMPISTFGEGLQRVISFLPGTYGTALVKNHATRGAFVAMAEVGVPAEVITGMRDAIDVNLYFFDTKVEPAAMYGIVALSIVALVGVYVLLNILKQKKNKI